MDTRSFETFGCMLFALVLVGALAMGVVAVGKVSDAVGASERAETEQAWARVEAIEAEGRARAEEIEARASRDREAYLHRETMFQQWTVALGAFADSNQGWIVALSALLGAGAAVAVTRWLGGRDVP